MKIKMDREEDSVQIIRQLRNFKFDNHDRLIERLELLNYVSKAVVSDLII